MDNAIWRIPAPHTKLGFEQQVPLSRGALSILVQAEHIERGDSDLVFPSRHSTVLGSSTLSHLCRALSLDVTPYQFRAAFRLWCLESGVPHELADVALGYISSAFRSAHVIPTYLERRRPLMQAWADFLAGDLADNWRWCDQ